MISVVQNLGFSEQHQGDGSAHVAHVERLVIAIEKQDLAHAAPRLKPDKEKRPACTRTRAFAGAEVRARMMVSDHSVGRIMYTDWCPLVAMVLSL